MDSFILEDVNSLLKLKKGDFTRLNHIKELCEANEIISLSDRKYIDRLSSQYLQKSDIEKPKKQDAPKFIPIEDAPTSSDNDEFKEIKEKINQFKEIDPPTVSSIENLTQKFDFLSNKKMIYAIGAIVLSVILIGIVAMQNDTLQLTSIPPTNIEPVLPFLIKTDEVSYTKSDIISISGKISSPLTDSVRVSIENEQDKLIWAENLDVKNNGEFSTLTLAGGVGWEKSGKYTLIAEHEDLKEEITFNFMS